MYTAQGFYDCNGKAVKQENAVENFVDYNKCSPALSKCSSCTKAIYKYTCANCVYDKGQPGRPRNPALVLSENNHSLCPVEKITYCSDGILHCAAAKL